MSIDKKLIFQLLTNYKKPEDILGENGLLKELTKAILERALGAEMTEHLGYEKHDPASHPRGSGWGGSGWGCGGRGRRLRPLPLLQRWRSRQPALQTPLGYPAQHRPKPSPRQARRW